MSDAEARILISGVCLLALLPASVFLVYRTLQTREERSLWEEGKRWLGIAGAFCSIEFLIYLILSAPPKNDVLGGVFPLEGPPPWGWTLLVQGVLFGLASGAVAWYRCRSRGAWFIAGLLFGPFGLVASAAVGDPESTETSPQESRGSGLCPNCGAHVEWGQGFCTECGHGFGRDEDEEEGIPVYTSEGKVGEITGVGRALFLLLLTGLAIGFFWGYYHLARRGHDAYLWCAFLGTALGLASAGGWYELLVAPADQGCGQALVQILVVFFVLAIAPVWMHFWESPTVTVEGRTVRVERTVPPICMEVDGILRLTENGTLERTADALGRAIYEAVSSGTGDPQSVVVSLRVPCYGGERNASDYAARDTIRGVSEIRAHAGAAAYAKSDHWAAVSRSHLTPEAPCDGRPYGLVEVLLTRLLVPLRIAWWALRTGKWGWILAGLLFGLWRYWKYRRAGTEDE